MNKKETKQVIIIRKDLNMRKGKMIASGAHASMKVFFDKMEEIYFTKGAASIGRWSMILKPTKAMKEWMQGLFTKITVSVDSEEELLHYYYLALNANLPCSLIEDAAKTEFKEPTYTAVAIGPDYADKIDNITGNLKLL